MSRYATSPFRNDMKKVRGQIGESQVGFVPALARGASLLSAVLLLLVLTPTPGFTQDSLFTENPVWFSGPLNPTADMAWGDVDGDGDLDLVCATSKSIVLYLNDGRMLSTQPAQFFTHSNSTWSICMGDVDGDGAPDLVCANNDKVNTLYLNVGGTFATEPAWSSGPANDTRDVVLGDIDGDGDLDLVCGNAYQSKTLYRNDGGVLTTQPVWSSVLTPVTWSVALGDMDVDGDLDLVCGNGGQNRIYRNDNGVLTTMPIWDSEPSNNTIDIALGDIDGDGDLDLVCANALGLESANNTLYINDWGVMRTQPSWISAPANETHGITLGDVDGDRDLDIICGNNGSNNTLYFNRGHGFSTEPDRYFTLAAQCVALGDVDGDGDLDLAFGKGGTDALYRNDANIFPTLPSWSSGPTHETWSIALGDVDGDDDLDLVCGNSPYDSPAGRSNNTLYRNDAGAFSTEPTWMMNETVATKSLALGDVDGDGDLDLVCGNGDDKRNALYLNYGGTFPLKVWESDAANSTVDVELGDVDGDGDLDLVCGNYIWGGNTLYDNIGGTFSTSPIWSSYDPAFTDCLALGDVDSDGDPDLFVAIAALQRVTLIRNESGTFAGGVAWEPGASGYTHALALADMDGDGDLDLVCGNDGVNTLYLNDGGTLNEYPSWSTLAREETAAVSAGDVDGDGDLDLLFGNVGQNTLYINEGGVVEITPTWVSDPEADTHDVALEDVDGDGDLDIVCGNFGSNTIYASTKNPPFKGDPLFPTHHLPNNSAHLRFVTVKHVDVRTIRVRFRAVDVESDPVSLVLDYRFEGVPTWYPADAAGQSGRVGPFATSPGGVADSVDWDTSHVPFDLREVVLRLRTIENPRRVSTVQYVASYQKDVGRLPSIATRAMPSTGSEYFEGRDIVVELQLPVGATPDQAQLHFRRGGENIYHDLAFDNSKPYPLATISQEWVGARGVEYWAELPTATWTLTDPKVDPSDRPKAIRVTVTDLREPRQHAGEQYRLMSVPLELEGELSTIRALEDDIGYRDPQRWRMFAFENHDSTYSYVEVPNDTLSSLEIGVGYWLITREPHRLDTAPVFGRSTPTDRDFQVTLSPGWNLVGQPFGFPVAWSSMTVNGVAMAQAEGSVVEPAVGWVGDHYQYGVARFVPWEGYWVKNLADSSVVLEIPPREIVASSPAAGSDGAPPDRTWAISIAASSMGAVDRYNYAGVARDAESGWDGRDRSEAPASPGKAISLYFPHSTWGERSGAYTVDVHGERAEMSPSDIASLGLDGTSEGHLWRFDVAKTFCDETAGDVVVLEFGGVEHLPNEAQILLVDRHLGRSVDLRASARYEYFQRESAVVRDEREARFLLLVGAGDFVERYRERLSVPPERTTLLQNHPNPFNPATIITYALSESGRVTLRVYSVTGTLVKILEDGYRRAGVHEVGWNGENSRGERVASGVYFYRLTAPGFSQTRKMVLAK